MYEWAGRQISGESPPPLDRAAIEATRKAKLCAWCFEPLGDQRAEFNGGVGHVQCARFAHDSVLGDAHGPAAPWLPCVRERHEDQLTPFVRRLGREAARLGIEPNRLAQAIERARRA